MYIESKVKRNISSVERSIPDKHIMVSCVCD